MKKRLILFLAVVLAATTMQAQIGHHSKAADEKTVIYLLPLSSEEVAAANVAGMNDPKEIHRTFARSVIGFWAGAQIGLDELGEAGRQLHVIARELNGDDSGKLQHIFADPEVQQADLIIAPVTKELFPAVAELARRYKIPVVNPLSSNSDIVSGNPYVYKMTPDATARAAALSTRFPGAHFILWGSHHASDYTAYFDAQGIAYDTLSDSQSFMPRLTPGQEHVVISCIEGHDAYNRVANALALRSRTPEFHWVLPESLLAGGNLDLTILAPFDIYFFTNYFVDDHAESIQVFRDEYARRYHTLPSVQNFAYQGYDATCFFIELIFNDFHVPQSFTPLSCQLKFKRSEKGNGFENHGIRLIRLDHLQYSIIQ